MGWGDSYETAARQPQDGAAHYHRSLFRSSNMAWQCPYIPLEWHHFNPHSFDFGDLVVLPDGPTGMVCKVGYKLACVDADTGADWRGLLTELRPAVPTEVGASLG